MKKLLLIGIMAVLVAGLVFAQGAREAAVDETFTLKFAHSMPTDTSRHQALLVFKEFVESESDGRLIVELYPGGQLGNEPEMIESMKMGATQGYLGGVFDAITPKLNLYLMPFLFADVDALMRVAESDLGAEIAADAENYSIKLLAVGDAGSRNFTNNVRPIRTPADLRGLRMRTPPAEVIIKIMESLGGTPVSIPYVETYMALRTGVVDGQENPFMNIVTMNFHEVQKYMTVVDYQFNPEPFCISLDWYNSLPADLQEILTEGAWVYTYKQNTIRAESAEADLQRIVDAGVEVYYPNDDERQLFIDASAPVVDFYINQGAFTREMYESAVEISRDE